MLSLDPENVRKAMESLSVLGYRLRVPVAASDFADPAKRESWIRDKNMVVFQLVSDLHPTVAIAVFVQEPFPFDAEWAHADVRAISADLSARVVSLPTLIALKRAANRPTDLNDIQMLTRQNAPEDLP